MIQDVNRITYEEVINGGDNATLERPLHTEEVLDLQWEQEHLKEGRYTLNMVKIDRKVREVLSRLKWQRLKKEHLAK